MIFFVFESNSYLGIVVTRSTLLSFLHDREASDSEDWGSLRKQLREFTVNTQQKLELERAGLMTENAMLQEEVKGLQEYIDNHLSRYSAPEVPRSEQKNLLV